MLLKYIFLVFIFSYCAAFAQMPNLRNNALNAPTNTIEASSEKEQQVLDEDEVFDEGNIIVGYGNVEMKKTLGGQDSCSVTVKLKNDTIYPLIALSLKIEWPSWQTPISFSNFTQQEENFIKYSFYGLSCYRLDAKPKIALTKCILGDKTLRECGGLIKVLPLSEI